MPGSRLIRSSSPTLPVQSSSLAGLSELRSSQTVVVPTSTPRTRYVCKLAVYSPFSCASTNRDAAPRTRSLHPIPRSSFYWHHHPQVQAQIRRHTPSIAELLPCGPWHSHHPPILLPGPQWVQDRIPSGHRPAPFA